MSFDTGTVPPPERCPFLCGNILQCPETAEGTFSISMHRLPSEGGEGAQLKHQVNALRSRSQVALGSWSPEVPSQVPKREGEFLRWRSLPPCKGWNVLLDLVQVLRSPEVSEVSRSIGRYYVRSTHTTLALGKPH